MEVLFVCDNQLIWQNIPTILATIVAKSRNSFRFLNHLFINIIIHFTDEEPENIPPQTHHIDLDNAGEDTSDIWQRRKPEESSEKKNKNGHSGLEFEA